MKQYLEAVIKNICKRQDDIVDVYEKKLKTQKKENKNLVKRIVSGRNGSGVRPTPAPRAKASKIARNLSRELSQPEHEYYTDIGSNYG